MGVRFAADRIHKFYVPGYPSTVGGAFPVKEDLVYKSSDLYKMCSSDLAGSTLGAILGIVSIVSTSTATLGYVAPVAGELLEIDFSTDWSTAVVSDTNINRMFRVSLSTVYGTVLDLSTDPVKVETYGSTVSGMTSSNKECFVVTDFSTVAKTAKGYIPSVFCHV